VLAILMVGIAWLVIFLTRVSHRHGIVVPSRVEVVGVVGEVILLVVELLAIHLLVI
jgi:hypothetical protein